MTSRLGSLIAGAFASDARSHGALQGLLSVLAALIAYLPTRPLGLQEGFWAAAITAVAVMQTELRATQSTARDQLVGAAIGGLTALLILSVAGVHVWAYALGIVVAMTLCGLLGLSTAARLSGTTVTIIIIVPHGGLTPMSVTFWRVAEVGWGVVVAVMVAWLAGRLRDRLSRSA